MNFRRKSSVGGITFQLAAMFDVAFLLLCFSVASQIYARWEEEIDITLPTAETATAPRRLEGEIVLNIQRDGSVSFNKRQLDDRTLSALLTRVVAKWKDQPVLIRADGRTAYANVVKVMDICRRLRIWNISFATGIPEKKGSSSEERETGVTSPDKDKK